VDLIVATARHGEAELTRDVARELLAAARGVPDLAGVLVLTMRARALLAANRPGAAEAAVEVCFLNPLHGPAQPERVLHDGDQVPMCRGCATGRTRQDTLPGLESQVAYFQEDPELSVWARTGYGAKGDDLEVEIIVSLPELFGAGGEAEEEPVNSADRG
jgi:hypothetical protein